MSRPEVIAHRGLPRQFRENTLRSFAAALEHQVDGIELDVHRTRDGEVVVHHDADVGGAPRPSLISETRLSDLRRLDPEIPTLDEVLTLVGARACVYVEIKAPRMEREVVDVLRRHPEARFAVHSFHHPTIHALQSIAAEIRTGVGIVAYPVRPAAVMTDAGASDFWVSHELIDAALVDAIHRDGGRVMAWTVNSVTRARSLAEMGVDGLCSDVSDQLVLEFRRPHP